MGKLIIVYLLLWALYGVIACRWYPKTTDKNVWSQLFTLGPVFWIGLVVLAVFHLFNGTLWEYGHDDEE